MHHTKIRTVETVNNIILNNVIKIMFCFRHKYGKGI